jgi:hypothetical protein
MTADMVGGIVRAILAAVGGALVTKGTVDSETWSLITGAVVAVGTAAWSVYTNRQSKIVK